MSTAIENAIENDVLKGCTVATNDKGSAFYIKDGKVIAECRKSKEYALDIERWYNADGKQHRDGDLPAETWCENGQKIAEFWHRDGKYHRDGGLPASIHYKNGQKTREWWYRDGKLHRDGDLPAMIRYKNGQKTREYWYRDGKEYIPEKPKMKEDYLAEIEAHLAEIDKHKAKIAECLAKIREETTKK